MLFSCNSLSRAGGINRDIFIFSQWIVEIPIALESSIPKLYGTVYISR